MFRTKSITTPAEFKAEDGEGSLSAVFSTFGMVDSDGDVLTPEAFTDGQSAPMVWSHDWSRPIGKGVVKVEPERAIFRGKLFLDTTDGLDAFRTIKAMGDLQEYSWGFRILDAEPGERDGMPVRYITKAELFEVSPVLIGANRETYTLAIKSADLKRHLSRAHMDRIIAVILEALSADEATIDDPAPGGDGKAVDPPAIPTLDLAGAKLLDDLGAYVTRLKSAPSDEVVAARTQMAGLLRQLSSTRLDLDALLKRANTLSETAPRELFDEFRRLDGLYGPHRSRQAG